MADDPTFDTRPPALAEECVCVSPLVRRVVAGNPGPITFTGTCSYIVGTGNVAIIDPGPDMPDHVEAILNAVRGETVTHILVTHTHKDHSPAAAAIKAATGAVIVGCAPHHSARPLFSGEVNTLEASSDKGYAPDQELNEGDAIEGAGWTLEALATPGHMANHLAFVLPEEKALFSGDHVMAWSTTVVAPPDGSMSAFMASLDKLRGREETLYWPGHGGPVQEPQRFVRALIHHRHQREASILNRLRAGDRTIPEIVAAIYQGLNPALVGAAGLSVFAHLEDLVAKGQAAVDGLPALDSEYHAV
ncbi:MBL fold metallo-hydrolase [Microvirga terrestris]|uniref:MBL fold metallo-hydrolase n=1 Tax=Microvirga terrestris TaxID=2791024 RepID=A0ABS0HPI1_9HYPH|nr:MBL fold metallo-hydrolase [Microvirga terrestris]MBF9195389.1 MBL fold metallo-hydrolase [Microvirga terrestris]